MNGPVVCSMNLPIARTPPPGQVVPDLPSGNANDLMEANGRLSALRQCMR